MTKRRVSARAPARGPRIFVPVSDNNWALELAEEMEKHFSPAWPMLSSEDRDEQDAIEEAGVLVGVEIMGPIPKDGKKGAKRP